jgi:hypothetical protein
MPTGTCPRRGIEMATHFDEELLARLAQRERLRIGIPAESREHVSRLWFVIHHGSVYIRSVRGEKAPWYRTLQDNPLATLHVARRHLPIRAVAVQEDKIRQRISEHFLQKYTYLYPSSLRAMLHEQVVETTLRLEPAGVEALV